MQTGDSFDICASEEAGPSAPTASEELITSGGLSRPAAAAEKFRCELELRKVCLDVTRCRRSFAHRHVCFRRLVGRLLLFIVKTKQT